MTRTIPRRLRRSPAAAIVTLVAFLAGQFPAVAHAQEAGPTPATPVGPALAGETAGIPEGGGRAAAGGLASADPATGIAHSSVQFQLETARGRSQPSLALTYSSAAGQREAGVGWGLNIASIERHNPSGGPQYKNDPGLGGAVTATTDRFEFGGAPLVPICLVSGDLHCEGALSGEAMPQWATGGWNYFRREVDNTYERVAHSAPRGGDVSASG